MVGNWFVDIDKDNLLCNRDCFASNDLRRSVRQPDDLDLSLLLGFV